MWILYLLAVVVFLLFLLYVEVQGGLRCGGIVLGLLYLLFKVFPDPCHLIPWEDVGQVYLMLIEIYICYEVLMETEMYYIVMILLQTYLFLYY